MDTIYQEIESTSEWLSKFGADCEGGITRLLYSNEWLEAQHALLEKFKLAQMRAYTDEIGNVFGQVKGSFYPDEVIMSGSHVDSVVNGGNLDGQFGIVAAYLAIKYLQDTYGQPLRTLEVVSLAEEEGSRFPTVFWGSKNILGLADNDAVSDIVDKDGIKFVDAMRQCNFDFKAKQQGRNDIKAFVELHIEQGAVLEIEKYPLGVVSSIVGQRRYTVTLKGEANHAGTTPMGYRKDTMYAFSKICHESIEKAQKVGDPLVLTYGKVTPKPNTVNVVPGETEFTIDCRHTDRKQLVDFTEELEQDINRICQEMGIEANIDLWMDEDPIPMDAELVDMICTTLDERNLHFKKMHSGAGHDAQLFAPHVPTAMIFTPSINGISHNPAEKTKTEDLTVGVKALADVLYRLAYVE
ncbi:allantoate amidohydrolase [Photobacterium sanctipauli]|uniref:Allantoate amidohydrolase n=2 Tax=Photobacterium sanctipauli TaxID=1342794 RepID=A0A2T3NU84_9GAMM|nr:allantoate deiminase [Photobacterium sanctipauli]PSW19834.1 allantoate amidohydrolase [Photobacterium sanctipauli]